MFEPDGQTTLSLEAMFDPKTAGLLFTAERLAARKLLTPYEMWPIRKWERRLGRGLTEEEEAFVLADAKALGMI
jgi:hypothetical protein